MRYLAICLLFLASQAVAGVTPERAAEIYMRAYTAYSAKHPGFRIPDLGPTVHVVSPERMQKLVTGGAEGTYYGLTDARGEIFVADYDMDNDPFHAGTLFHEMIHFFQFAQRGETRTCADAADRENEAYSMEAREMDNLGASDVMIRVRQALSGALYQIAVNCKDN